MILAWLALLAGLLVSPVEAASIEPVHVDRLFRSVGDARSIVDDVVTTIVQDHDGFLWIGTPGDLVRFDGHRFRNYAPAAGDPATIPGSFIRALHVARDGRLWVGMESDGMVVYDPVTERFESPAFSDPDTKRRAGTVNAFAEAADGTLYIGSIGGGVLRWDPLERIVVPVPLASSAEPDGIRQVQSLLVDRRGTLWIGGWNGLLRADLARGRAEPLHSDGVPVLAGRWIWGMHEATDGRLWVGSRQGDLRVIDPLDGSVQRPADPDSNGAAAVFTFAQPSDGRIWVGRGCGIDIFDARTLQKVGGAHHDPAEPWGLAADEVRTMLVDHAGWLWLGGYGVGLQKHDPVDRGIAVRRERSPGFDGVLARANVTAVHAADDGRVWLGTGGSGVAVLDRSLRLVDGFAPSGRVGGLPEGYVTAIEQAGDDALWIGTDAALYRLTPSNRRFERIAGATGGSVRTLLRDADGVLWIGMTHGLFRLRAGSAAAERLAGAATGAVSALAPGPARQVWVGSSRGLFLADAVSDRLQAVGGQAGAGLRDERIIGLLTDARGTLWVDTVAGLHRMLAFDGARASFDPIGARHGRAQRPFGANLLDDARGRIWSHRHVYFPAADTLVELSAADGVDIGTGWFRSYDRTAEGRLLFGGSKGLLVITPERYLPWNFDPPLRVSELRVDERRRPLGDGIVLAPGERGFQLEFAALDPSAPELNRYRYRLLGYDDADMAGSQRTVFYENLPPGRYTLQLHGSNRHGEFASTPLEIPVEVQPTWWQTGLFHLLTLVAALGGVWGVVRMRTLYLLRRKQRLEQLVDERTAQLQAMSQQLWQHARALEDASLTDPLTGLRNRRFITSHMATEAALVLRRHLSRPTRDATDADLVFAIIDLDHFKRVNDDFGHAAGDAVLQQMRDRLQQACREGDYLARWGGEEFLVVARGTSRAHASALAERIRTAVRETPFTLPDNRRLTLHCSIGFAAYPFDLSAPAASDWQTVIDIADAGLLAAKRCGRDGWVGIEAGRRDDGMPRVNVGPTLDAARVAAEVAQQPQVRAVDPC